MAAARTSLLEQKRLQWAKEREEMSRLTGGCAPLKTGGSIRTAIRTFSNDSRASLAEMNGKHQPHYASTVSLRSLASDASAACSTAMGLHHIDCSTASLINLRDQVELERYSRRRSPSLPPIHSRDEYYYQEELEHRQEYNRDSRASQRCRQQHRGRTPKVVRAAEEREGETSGYASDSHEGRQQQQQGRFLPSSGISRCPGGCGQESALGERTWQNPYCNDENSVPGSGKGLGTGSRGGEFNRQRWGSVWGQDASPKDPPPPSWLERGLSRLDHSSQVLVINHESASSPDSSTTGSIGSESHKTYLRGQNLPIDADILQEREARRQKALELQKAIKQQLEERERHRAEERERKLREERAEEERIERERDLEQRRLEEERRRQREREAAKLQKTRAMQEVLQEAEREAKEEKRQRRRRDEAEPAAEEPVLALDKETKQPLNGREVVANEGSHEKTPESEDPVRLPVSQDVAIVLSGRIEDPDLLGSSPLKLVNLVVSPSPRGSSRHEVSSGLGAFLAGIGGPLILQARASSQIAENRLLTPSKYRLPNGRDCSTQTDCEGGLSDVAERMQEITTNETKERKQAAINNRRDTEKSTINGPTEESLKQLARSKAPVRPSLEARPRWNANRPGTRYRTQSEKDPHYQRRMRLRRRQFETSDEGSSDFRRSPSPGRRKYGITKAKSRSSARRKAKVDNYDADLSMDSLNSLVPLHTDKNGRITVERRDDLVGHRDSSDRDLWCGEDILSHLTSLRNGLIMKKREWDLEDSPISPITELY